MLLKYLLLLLPILLNILLYIVFVRAEIAREQKQVKAIHMELSALQKPEYISIFKTNVSSIAYNPSLATG